ncbi:MAG: beta-N-acetylhexosaminidase [Bacteroidaceae bacterium]|nr:beta-N-acetylhexosaminidase [Bacteroidaceae bacterium]
MKLNNLLLLCAALFSVAIFAQSPRAALLPMPNQMEVYEGKKPFRFSEKAVIWAPLDELDWECKQLLVDVLKKHFGVELKILNTNKAAFKLQLDPTIDSKEGYQLEVTSKCVKISAATGVGLFYGIQTLDQILMGDQHSTLNGEICQLKINDAPRFGFRALMLDPARHFLPVKDVKFFIDQMARYKFNVLQLHLTDDQGWRVEIKSQPKLASKQHYTQEELRDIVEYARKRGVEVIPEVDVPGHTVAILAAYPHLACTHKQEAEKKVGETVNMMLCAAQEEVYDVMADVVREISEIFESPYFHLGGDEAAVPENWAKCDACKQMMERLGYTKPTQLMIPFFNRVLDEVRKNDKKPILWCELNNIWPPADDYLFPYPKDVTLVTWRNALTPTCLDLTRKNGHNIIMAPGEHAYLDYPQYRNDFPEFNNWGMPITTLQKTYELDPAYGCSEADAAHIQGVMGTLWAEAIPDVNRATYMAFPRALALAEAGWSEMPQRSWDSFKQRIFPNIYELMKQGVSVRVPYEIVERKQIFEVIRF